MKEINEKDLENAAGGLVYPGVCPDYEPKCESYAKYKFPKNMRICELCAHFATSGRISGKCDLNKEDNYERD